MVIHRQNETHLHQPKFRTQLLCTNIENIKRVVNTTTRHAKYQNKSIMRKTFVMTKKQKNSA